MFHAVSRRLEGAAGLTGGHFKLSGEAVRDSKE